jgi:non-heme chloroperoxidase
MIGGAKPYYDRIKAFSETDQTYDLKAMTVPTLVMEGSDDQIVPNKDASLLQIKPMKNGTIKIYDGFPHGMLTTHTDFTNSDLFALSRAD